MSKEPFRMSIESIETTTDGTFFDGKIEQGILYEGDSIRLGRMIFPIRLLKTKESKSHSPNVIITPLSYQGDAFDDFDGWHIMPRQSTRLFFPHVDIPKHLIEHAKKLHFVNRSNFYMPIEDIFTIKGRGVCVAGSVRYGILRRGCKVKLINDTSPDTHSEIVDFMSFGHVEIVEPRDNISLLLKDVSEHDVTGKFMVTTDGISK